MAMRIEPVPDPISYGNLAHCFLPNTHITGLSRGGDLPPGVQLEMPQGAQTVHQGVSQPVLLIHTRPTDREIRLSIAIGY